MLRLAPAGLLSVILFSCDKSDTPPGQNGYPDMARLAGATVLTTNAAGVKVYNGGYGSALAPVPGEAGSFYLMTDRGPNADGADKDSKIFPAPDFNPHIGKFRLEGDSLVKTGTISLKTTTGSLITGRPNPAGEGNSGEIALDMQGRLLPQDPDGLDCEGLAVAPDGSFWISDEYGPHILHVDAGGKTLARINPYGSGAGGGKIPKVFATRRPNRGMEGLTITPDGKTLVGMMQSPMYNPSKDAVKQSLLTRILTYDIATGATRQYLYRLEDESTANSEIAAISNNSFLVLERDGEYPGSPKKPSAIKRIYRIELSAATDVSDPANGANGKLVNGKTLEQLSDAELQAASIKPVSKELVTDLLKDVKDYPHDKAEGLAVINSRLIAVSNDDDFGIVSPDPATNEFIEKILPLTGKTDFNTVYFIRLAKPLY
jgi:hypothetical protein